MNPSQEKIECLNQFISRDKFSVAAWNERGLNPSNSDLCAALSNGFNGTAHSLITAIRENKNKPAIKKILHSSISDCRTLELDTEEKEFACDLYSELSHVVGVDLKYRLSVFLYGYFLTFLMISARFFKPERIVAVMSQPCAKCKANLEALITKKQSGIPDNSWLIGKCYQCNEYNLFSFGPDIKEITHKNYSAVEYLSKDEFNHEQALLRLEQIRFFRK